MRTVLRFLALGLTALVTTSHVPLEATSRAASDDNPSVDRPGDGEALDSGRYQSPDTLRSFGCSGPVDVWED